MPDAETTSTGVPKRPEHDLTRRPVRTDTTLVASLPESFRYRVKRRLLGPPLVSDELAGQRLGKPTALAVLSSDVMSSSAYASEQMIRVLVPIGGLAAFSLVTPLTAVILAVLAVVTICYRDVVRSYPKAGGSYVVSRDNFGPNVAQIAGAALLISYTITVAVSVAAGADAIISAVPVLAHDAVPMSVGFVAPAGLRQPAGHPRGRAGVRHPHLLLHRQHGPAHRGRPGQGGHHRAAPRPGGQRDHAARPRRRGADPRDLRLLPAPGLRPGQFGHDRDRGHLQRGEHLPDAPGPQRPHHAGAHEHASSG